MIGRWSVSRMNKGMSFSLRSKPVQLTPASRFPALQHELVNEELCPTYDSIASIQLNLGRYLLITISNLSKLVGAHVQQYG